MATDKMLSRKDGPIGSMIFNNPERHNATSLEMWQAADEILQDFANDPQIRVVVLSGAGGKAFVSGADISKFEDERATEEAIKHYNKTSDRMSTTLQNMPKPTIAMIQGWCIGGGVSVATTCDLRVCTEESKFGVPAAKLGLGYGIKGIRRLVNLVGPAAAKEIFFTARHYTAQEALRMGLVNQVVPAGELESYVRDYAATIAGNAPLTVNSVKRIVGEILKDPQDRDLELCDRLVAECFASQDYIEGRRAFMEKRKPNFIGR
jgi:enoyl-CoA hydratase